MLLFLAHLQTWQMGVLQLQVVLLSEVLRHRAFNRLTIFKLQRKPADLRVIRFSCSGEPEDSLASKQRAECDAETYVWRLAGRRVTLQTRYFLRMVPQCVTSTFRPEKMVEASKKISMKNMKK